jgi:hypothetical protein
MQIFRIFAIAEARDYQRKAKKLEINKKSAGMGTKNKNKKIQD